MVAARAKDVDIQFLREIAAMAPDDLYRDTATRAIAALHRVPAEDSPRTTGDPRADATGIAVRREFLRKAGFPADLTPLRELAVEDGEDLLTDLLDILLQRATEPNSAAELRLGTARLRLVVAAVTRDSTRAVTARLNGPAQALSVLDEAWVDGLLSLVRPRDLLAAARRATDRPEHRLTVLRALAREGDRLGEPRLMDTQTGGPSGPLRAILDKGHETRRHTRGERIVGSASASRPGESPELRSDGMSTRRTAHPLLDAPRRVTPGATFELRVGLSDERDPAVVASGVLRVPVAAFELTVTLFHDGFAVLGKDDSTVRLHVPPGDPFPYAVLRLRALADDALVADRTITAIFEADGMPVGSASRSLLVTTDTDPDEEEGDTAAATAPAGWSFDLLGPRPDVELYLVRGEDRAGRRWLWHIRSPHLQVPDTDTALLVDVDNDMAAMISRFIRGVEQREGRTALPYYLNTMASRVGELVHDRVWDALAAVAAKVGRPPSVLLVTGEAYIPWELARVPSAEDRPWLGAQTVLGRWPYLNRRYAQHPPATIDATRLAVVYGAYPASIELPAAKAEGEGLVSRYAGTAVTPTVASILDMLGGKVPADVLHVALHGNFDSGGDEDGILMIDGEEYLAPEDIEGVGTSAVRLAFLNACQVARGREVFGNYAGMAAALIRIGVGGLVAPLWKVDDEVAGTISDAYYADVFAGTRSPASFLRRLRCEATGVESTHLAYVFFGHPLLEVIWRGETNDG
jgi:hypothetical protein